MHNFIWKWLQAQFSGQAVTIPQNCTDQAWGRTIGQKCAPPKGKTEPSFSILRNVFLVR